MCAENKGQNHKSQLKGIKLKSLKYGMRLLLCMYYRYGPFGRNSYTWVNVNMQFRKYM